MMTDKKPDLDLDFGDISSKQMAPTPIEKAPEPEAKLIERSGVFLPIPMGKTPLSSQGWQVKELEDCNGEEFLLWAESVCYNFIKDPDPKDFDHLKIRVRAYKKIEAFHKRLNFSIPGITLPTK